MCFVCQIPSSAVEMPGSADVFGLNVQFGALDFGSESTVENINQSESSFQEPVATPQTQSSLYSKSTAIRYVCPFTCVCTDICCGHSWQFFWGFFYILGLYEIRYQIQFNFF